MITAPLAPSSSTDDPPAGPFVWMIAGIAALGGLLFGYDWVVIGGAKPFYEVYFGLTTPALQGWAMGCALLGSLVGALASGAASDRWGRKRLLLASALLFAASSLGTGLAVNFAVFIAWRIAGGMAIGLASNLSPLYIAEIAPARSRGRLVAINQLTIVVGILLAQVANWLIADRVAAGAGPLELLHSWNGQTGWRIMFAVTAVPSVLFLVGVLFVPESPRWLAQQGRTDQARAVLARIGGAVFAECEIVSIRQTLPGPAQREAATAPSPRGKLGSVLLIGIGLAVFQQWCGINVVFNYAQEIFSAAGYSVSDILFNIVVTGSVNLVFTLVALGTVDRWGRRPLLLFGAAGLAISYVILGALLHAHSRGPHVLAMVLLAIGCYAMSLAPVTWVVISEIFPNRIRGRAMSIAVGALWIACFMLTYSFPFLNQALGAAGTFWIYAAICAVGFVFVYLKVPETKGRSLEEIEAQS